MSDITNKYQKAHEEREAHKAKLARKYVVEGHPKLNLCYDLAWEHGHSNGLDSVEGYFSDFVELIKP